ncbi:MAG: hypothetical protein ACLQGP_00910 [Isosphaeraceae bacterium]
MPLESKPAEPMPDPKSLPLMHRILVKLLVGRDGGPPRWGYVVFTLSALALDAFAWTIFAAEWRKLHGYAETTCTVLAKRLEEFGGDATTYRPDMRIHYTVGGREYETWTYDSTRAAGLNRRASQEALDPFALNGRYPCWYDPADPSKVVVVRGHAGFTWIFLATTAVLTALGVWGFTQRRRPASPDGTGTPESSGWLPDAFDPLVRRHVTPVASPPDLDTTRSPPISPVSRRTGSPGRIPMSSRSSPRGTLIFSPWCSSQRGWDSWHWRSLWRWTMASGSSSSAPCSRHWEPRAC